MQNLFDTLKNILSEDKRFITEKGKVLRNAVYEAGMKMDKSLLKMLLSNAATKEKFFQEVELDGNKTLVFDKVGFGWVVSNKEFLPDSYTRYKNKIGLVDGNNQYISNSNDVELVFPYKDCVLVGGQTKEDQKRNEIFFNETLAPDEVDRLLAPKVFVNAKRYTKDGVEQIAEFKDSDNLIIKGNNLLALESLLTRFEGQVKCIYIDPPYYFKAKKSEDTFAYNSNFKFSSWLTFMKNRLKIAYKLLQQDGALFVQISDDGVGEMHCLLKDIFGVENFINKITVKTKSPSGFASVNPGVFETAEYILSFAKNKKKWKYNTQYVESGYDINYKFTIINKNESVEKWEIDNIVDVIAKERGYSNATEMRTELGKPVIEELIAQYAFNNADSVFRYTAIGDNAGQNVVETRNLSKKIREKIFMVEREGQYTVYIHKGQELAFYSKKIREVDGKLVPSMQVSNIWTDTPYEGISSEGGVTLKGGKKPEKLIRRIIEMASNPGELIMDYHLGSGTTCAVAHKIGRRYIGIEQLEYGENDSTVRLQAVINGDNTGISNAVNWQGGGSFVYCELAQLNQKYVDALQEAETDAKVTDILKAVLATGFISDKVNPKLIDTEAEDYKALSLDEKKAFVMEVLDSNLLYVNYSDIDDKEFAISDADKAFTKSFYGEE